MSDDIAPPYIIFSKNPPPFHAFHITDKLRDNGYFIVEDPKYTSSQHDTFINTIQTYFNLGHIPTNNSLSVDEHPPPPPPQFRYFWKTARSPPSNTTYKELIVIPEGFSDLKETMDTCANKMLATVQEVAEKAATGFLLLDEEDAFTSKMNLEVGLKDLTSKNHMKVVLRWMRERQKLRLVCNHVGAHKQFLYTTWFTIPGTAQTTTTTTTGSIPSKKKPVRS